VSERTWAICAPMWLEAVALRRGLAELPPGERAMVHHTGVGPRRAYRAASSSVASADLAGASALAVAGVGGGLSADLRPGDVVVATQVRADPLTAGVVPPVIMLPTARMLAATLRRRGLRVHMGGVVSSDRLADGPTRERLAATGALVADTESAWLLSGGLPSGAPTDRPLACVRVIADTPPGGLYRPATLAHLRAALKVLPVVGAGLAEWAAATTVERVVLAAPRSYCAGVSRAIAAVEQALLRHGPPVYVRKQIVHNAHMVADLRARGAVFVDEVDEVPEGALTVFSAHGVSPAVRHAAAQRRLAVVDATCPLVTKVHAEARRFAARYHTILLVGHPGHEETDGTIGEAPDLVSLVPDVYTAERVQVADPRRVSYLVQTTLAIDEAAAVVDVLRRRFPALTGPPSDDVCYATTNRQRAVAAIAADADVVLVVGSAVGSANSSNSQRLVEVAERVGARAYLVDDVSGVDLRWLAGAATVGVTAGASAPPRLVTQVSDALVGLGAREVAEDHTGTEDVRFTLPRFPAPAVSSVEEARRP
jgi:4-hydroxy-3-methylbut-2-enyl diphosphate reductase